jgi:hypothetical protein
VFAWASEDDLATFEEAAERMERARDGLEMVRCDIEFHDAVWRGGRPHDNR